jgi:putrescine aminotransferase
MAAHPAIELYAKHVNPAFVKLLGVLGYGRVFTRALGTTVWDHEGQAYLDALAGFGSVPLGHNPPRLMARLREFLSEDALHFSLLGPSPQTALIAQELARLAGEPLSICLLASSGSEAVEAGMKLARAATRREDFVSCEGGFHGTNLGTLSIMGGDRMRRPFEPLLAHCHRVPFGDLRRLEGVLAPGNVAGFIVEPLQAEGGVVLPPPGYLAAAQALCRKHGALLILDEVQTGLGRTGSMFAFQAEGFVPDVLVLAKALSGGVAAVSAALTTRDIHERAYGAMDRFDLHSSTYGGNAFGCTAALTALQLLQEEQLAANAATLGKRLLEGLQARLKGHPLVRDVRGRGLLVGVEMGPTDAGWLSAVAPGLVAAGCEQVFGQWAALKLLEKHILVQPASLRWNVLRLEPPLVVSAAEVDRLIAAVGEVFDSYESIVPVLKDAGARVLAQSRRDWAFP